MRTAIRNFAGLVTGGALLAGCAHPAGAAESVELKDDEGIIDYRMACGPQVMWGEFYHSGQSAAGYFAGFKRAGALLCQPGVQTQRIKAGGYFRANTGAGRRAGRTALTTLANDCREKLRSSAWNSPHSNR